MFRNRLLHWIAALGLVALTAGCADVATRMGPPTYAPNSATWSGEPTGIYVGVGGPMEISEITDLRLVVRQVRAPIPGTDPILPPQP
jgi:hypothetical protein